MPEHDPTQGDYPRTPDEIRREIERLENYLKGLATMGGATASLLDNPPVHLKDLAVEVVRDSFEHQTDERKKILDRIAELKERLAVVQSESSEQK